LEKENFSLSGEKIIFQFSGFVERKIWEKWFGEKSSLVLREQNMVYGVLSSFLY